MKMSIKSLDIDGWLTVKEGECLYGGIIALHDIYFEGPNRAMNEVCSTSRINIIDSLAWWRK